MDPEGVINLKSPVSTLCISHRSFKLPSTAHAEPSAGDGGADSGAPVGPGQPHTVCLQGWSCHHFHTAGGSWSPGLNTHTGQGLAALAAGKNGPFLLFAGIS